MTGKSCAKQCNLYRANWSFCRLIRLPRLGNFLSKLKWQRYNVEIVTQLEKIRNLRQVMIQHLLKFKNQVSFRIFFINFHFWMGSKFGLVRVSKQPHFQFPHTGKSIYKRPGFLADIWFGSSPHPLPPLPSGDGEGAKSYDGETAWSSKNHSVLSAIKISVVEFAYLWTTKLQGTQPRQLGPGPPCFLWTGNTQIKSFLSSTNEV